VGTRLCGLEGVRWTGGPVVLLGASYIAAWKLERVGARPVLNRGIPGNQTHEYVERFERDVVAAQPRAVVIWGIDNDVIRAPREGTDAACARAERNLETLLELAWSHGIEPILTTDMTLRPPDRWGEGLAALIGTLRGKEGYQQRINRHVLAINVAIRALAQRAATHLLDLTPLTTGANGMRLRAFAMPDGSHIPDAGYAAIEAYAVPRLEGGRAAP
jgi:hypothetical protein